MIQVCGTYHEGTERVGWECLSTHLSSQCEPHDSIRFLQVLMSRLSKKSLEYWGNHCEGGIVEFKLVKTNSSPPYIPQLKNFGLTLSLGFAMKTQMKVGWEIVHGKASVDKAVEYVVGVLQSLPRYELVKGSTEWENPISILHGEMKLEPRKDYRIFIPIDWPPDFFLSFFCSLFHRNFSKKYLLGVKFGMGKSEGREVVSFDTSSFFHRLAYRDGKGGIFIPSSPWIPWPKFGDFSQEDPGREADTLLRKLGYH